MIQLSLFSPPLDPSPVKELSPVFFCDVFVYTVLDEKTKRIRVKPLPDQPASSELFIRCSHKARRFFPVGTVFKMDLCLKQGLKGKKYFIARAGRRMQRANLIPEQHGLDEYFDHNLMLQKSI